MTETLLQTPLHQLRLEQGVRMVDFAGWAMPIQHTSIIQEHRAVRNAAGLFDVSHMGRFVFLGPDAQNLLERLLTRRVQGMKTGAIRYSLIVNAEGGALDDVLVYSLQGALSDEAPDQNFFLLVVNAGNRRKIADWITAHTQPGEDIGFTDHTPSTAMIAVQGPRALEIAQPLFDRNTLDLSKMRYYTGTVAQIDLTSATNSRSMGIVSRTGYTGEDGCELIVPAEIAPTLWNELLRNGEPYGVVSAGLGARDTLRLEAAMPLYGHELTEQIDPYQAGLAFAVNLKDRDFIGRQALERISQNTDRLKRVGLEVSGRRAARQSYQILSPDDPTGNPIGEVTSGAFSPTFERPLAMGYIAPPWAKAGTEVLVDIRGAATPAKVTALPFYKRES